MTRSKIAIFSARGLGDGLLMMIFSQHLSVLHDVVLYNSNLAQIAGWFPHKMILPFPKDTKLELASYDQIITTRHTPVADWKDLRVLTLQEQDFDKQKTMVQNLVQLCQSKLGLKHATSYNGLVLPEGIVKKRYPNRIAIHAMSSDDKKTWPKDKFFRLAFKLKKCGYDVSLCVAPYERELWKAFDQEDICIPRFLSLEEFATYIAESGFVIGNDSGMGHLASNIGIPTLSLFARGSQAKLWRPGWEPGSVVTPIPFAIGAKAKQYLWKKFLPVNRVYKSFCTLKDK